MCIRDSYYLRDRTGKSARIAEKIRKKIGIDVDTKPETVNEENVVPAAESAPEAKTPTKEASAEEVVPATETTKTEVANEDQKLESPSEKK